jgi:hypothetical protein
MEVLILKPSNVMMRVGKHLFTDPHSQEDASGNASEPASKDH